MDLGVFSLFGEYDKYLLEEYDVFAFNGSYGTGTFSIGDVEERLDRYMSKNAKPGTTLFSHGHGRKPDFGIRTSDGFQG